MKIPVVFLNLRGYDSHFITDANIGEIARKNKMEISAIPIDM